MLGRITCICFILFFVTTVVSAQTVTIYRGGVALAPTYSTVKNAVANAVSNDSLVLSADVFYENNIRINVSLTLMGTILSSNRTIINAAGASPSNDYSAIVFNLTPTDTSEKKLVIKDIDITKGWARGLEGGGAIYTHYNTLVVLDGATRLYDNYALAGPSFPGGLLGGGIYSKDKVIIKGNSQIYSNKAVTGGGVYCVNLLILKENVKCSLNTGGAIYGNSDIYIEDSVQILSNTGINGGAGVYSNGNVFLKGGVGVKKNIANYGNGGGIFVLGNCTLNNSVSIDSNFSGENGGGVYSSKDILIGDSVGIKNNNAKNGGGAYALKNITLSQKARIQNNTASQDGGGLYIFGEAQVLDSSIIQSNTADNGGACYVNNGLVYLKNTAKVNANAAQQKGGAFFFKNGYFRMADSAIISDNTTNLNYSSAIYCNGNNDITISGGQIVGNHSTDTNANGLGMALYSDSLTGTSSVIKINNARIFNPRHGNARQNEFYNLQPISAFLSDSTWWGESDTSGLIYNASSATVALRSWITCEWMLNAGIPIGMSSSFPLEAYFTLYTGAPIPPSMFWMLKGHFSSDFGTFTPPIAGMAATNIVSSVYTVPLSTSGVYLLATIDADTFRKSVYVHGTDIGKQYTEQQKAIHIYPNPATNNLNIVCKDDHTKYGKAIFKDVLGRVVLEEKFILENKQSQLTFNLLAGVYIVELVLEGNVKQAERLVVL
jgi:predicted outer membrane repeat protein